MLVPGGVTLLWMGVFGNSGIELIMQQGAVEFGAAVQENQAVALFRFMEYLPFSRFLSFVSVIMVVIFFVTSADSGAMVLNMLSSRGRDDTPALQRVVWTISIGVIAVVLLVAGGLSSLQTAAIASALPFSVALLCAIWGFARALQIDVTKRNVLQSVVPSAVDGVDWRRRLGNLLRYPGDNAVQRFEKEVVLQQYENHLQFLHALR